MKKLILSFIILIAFLFTFSFLDLKAATYTDTQLPTNLISNPYQTITFIDVTYQDYWKMYSNYNYYDDGLVVYFPQKDELDNHLWYQVATGPSTFAYSGIEYYDASYNLIEFESFRDNSSYFSDIYGAWYPFETLSSEVVYFRVKMLYVGDDSYSSNQIAKSLNDALWVSQASIFMNWILNDFDEVVDGYYNSGQYDIYHYGSAAYGFNQYESFDALNAIDKAHTFGFEEFTGFNKTNETSFTYEKGYEDGYADNSPISFLGLISASGMLLNVIFTTEIFKGITIGLFVLIPLLIALLGLFLRLRKGG